MQKISRQLLPVSIPANIQSDIDAIANEQGRSRSYIFDDAFSRFIHSHIAENEWPISFKIPKAQDKKRVNFSVYVSINSIQWLDLIASRKERDRNPLVIAVLRHYLYEFKKKDESVS